jgi:hypothetical protein
MFIAEQEEVLRILLDDDGARDYVTNMTSVDRKVRAIAVDAQAATVLTQYAASVLSHSNTADKLAACVAHCIELLGRTSLADLAVLPHICISKQDLEGGMPFTLSNVIFLPINIVGQADASAMTRILLHEMMHVFQRKHPERFAAILERLAFSNISNTHLATSIRKKYNVRSNPDTAMCPIWMKHVTGLGNIVHLFIFHSARPSNLNDGRYVTVSAGEFSQNVLDVTTLYEHPYEMMAETCARLMMHSDTKGVCTPEERDLLHGFLYT